jgi:catechol 2,3-dioxygenase-like lactoylglutathione lyase family enzyme
MADIQTTPAVRSASLSHGTLESADLQATRRFYEEVLGLNVRQLTPLSIHVDLGDGYMYAVVHAPNMKKQMPTCFRNTLLFGTESDIEAAHRAVTAIQAEYGIRQLTEPHRDGARYLFWLRDLDGNLWELAHDMRGGYHNLFPRSHDVVA